MADIVRTTIEEDNDEEDSNDQDSTEVIASDNAQWPSKSNRSRLDESYRNEFKYSRLETKEPFTRDNASKRKLHLLPALASAILLDDEYVPFIGTWRDPALRTLLLGTRDENSSLSVLGNFDSTIMRLIYSYIPQDWSDFVTLTIPAHCIGKSRDSALMIFTEGRPVTYDDMRSYKEMDDIPPDQGCVSFARCGKVNFPEPNNRNVNMMPFIIGDIHTLPEELKCYYPLIETCPYDDEEIGEVGYLTVHESFVEKDDAQRRQGLHIEAPGGTIRKPSVVSTGDGGSGSCRFSPSVEHHWGMGVFFGCDRYWGGMYVASNVDDTNRVWDALVHDVPGIVDTHGGCEHLRSLLGPGTALQANELIWMTDRTPHEALPQSASGHRQFFRMVTSRVSHWFADHNTPNPKVPLPDHVIVVRGNKFT